MPDKLYRFLMPVPVFFVLTMLLAGGMGFYVAHGIGASWFTVFLATLVPATIFGLGYILMIRTAPPSPFDLGEPDWFFWGLTERPSYEVVLRDRVAYHQRAVTYYESYLDREKRRVVEAEAALKHFQASHFPHKPGIASEWDIRTYKDHPGTSYRWHSPGRIYANVQHNADGTATWGCWLHDGPDPKDRCEGQTRIEDVQSSSPAAAREAADGWLRAHNLQLKGVTADS
jgi:hypothetical protein